ncbi:MAG: PD-(D/E)XK nuclease family protein, partial [Candidatus Avelusimicrobium sp.]
MNGEADIERLLKQVTEIRLRHEEEARRTGENWNVFYAIGKRLYKRELLHSHFISVLLEPKNPAGKGSIFLKLFLETLAEACEEQLDISAFCTGNVKIITEKNIGPITKDYESGGRIDIFIENGRQQIVIENKIYAEEQQNQLYRYHKKYPNAILFYLTLNGKEATKTGLKDLRQDQY